MRHRTVLLPGAQSALVIAPITAIDQLEPQVGPMDSQLWVNYESIQAIPVTFGILF